VLSKKLGNKKVYLTISGVILIVVALLFGTAFNKDTVASVDGESITKGELYDVMVKQYGQDSLSYLINNKIVEIAAGKENVKISDEDVDAEMKEFVEANGGEESFNYALEQSGLTKKDIETEIVNYLKIVKLLESEVDITDEEMKTHFEENKDSYNEPEQVEASHILVKNEETTNKVKEKLEAGEDFAELAKEYSTDTSNAENGGELGYFSKGTMVEEFENIAFSMNVGEISDPVKTDYGYHIIHVTDKKEAKEANFEDHKEEIEQTLFDQEISTEYSTWITEQREKLEIENTLDKK
jgi:foldase protein PrsA